MQTKLLEPGWELTEEQLAFPHRWGTQVPPGPLLLHGLEFAPQQMPGTQSQLGGLVGLVGGRWKIRWKIA